MQSSMVDTPDAFWNVPVHQMIGGIGLSMGHEFFYELHESTIICM